MLSAHSLRCHSPSARLLWPLLLLLALWLPAQAHAQDEAPASLEALESELDALPEFDVTPGTRLEPSEQDDALRQLRDIQRSLVEVRSRGEILRHRLQSLEADEEEYQQIREQLEQLEQQRRNLREIFEDVAIGGLDRSILTEQVEQEDFNWQDELLSIMRPLFSEMRQLTERPRTLERLRRDRALIHQRLGVINQALNNIEAFAEADHDEATASRLEALAQAWRDRQEDLQRQQAIVQLQLDNLMERDESIYEQGQRALREFFVGRGLTLLVAIGALALTILVLQGGMNRLLRYRERRGIPRRGMRTRLFLLGYRLVAALLSVMVFMMVLYAAGDLVLFSLALLLIVALLLSFRTYLPRYLAEARLFLNAGQVRERERVIYAGIPWRVRAIGFYSWLVNPELENGRLRLPLSELATLISRPLNHDEPWFPTRAGDYVLLEDGTFGQVARQSPEVVQLRVLGNLVQYDTAGFLAARPRNLSRDSYLAVVIFGIDYRHQSLPVAEVSAIFREAVLSRLADSEVAEWVESVSAEFREAADSSLDYQIMATLSGEAAAYYFKVNRLIQAACVQACNEHGWGIPFNQLTIHQGEGFARLNGPAG
ncbi:hypothetical protein HOP52_07335 [Halomonas campisalis]|uniref:Mechanosensitive ion channel n=1 Tax=Billgrantia campisalis TaxID=74661 RepID=A0ABS9P703_9GAMM|nr:hypothetical protein [Halomonas campisalis]MCG6657574.1 hypothetical protein [Halomonas campisalis]MDR5862652.1 hypothetical protein [Halomonas campisalis]